MDFYLDNQNCIDRLVYEWKEHGNIIIAVDYDDTLYDFHKKGREYNHVINLLRQCRKIGCYIIIFTACGEEQYSDISNYLKDKEIPFDKINENVEFIKFTGRKIYYNILLDDRAGLGSAYDCLKLAVTTMEIDKANQYYIKHAL
jgi:hydroxymethylpyrimidine pyrophosphatase-like HAD family hydrolase